VKRGADVETSALTCVLVTRPRLLLASLASLGMTLRIRGLSSIEKHRVTATQFRSISMPADFCRHLVGKTLRNVCHCDSTEIRFVGKSVII